MQNVAGRNQKGEILIQQQIEKRLHFSPEELKSYNEIYPEFGSEYLKNIIELPREASKQSFRSHVLYRWALGIAGFIVLAYMAVICYLFYCGQYEWAVKLVISSVAALTISFLSIIIKGNKTP